MVDSLFFLCYIEKNTTNFVVIKAVNIIFEFFRQMQHLRDYNRKVGSEKFGAFPKAVQRRDDGTRDHVFEDLKKFRIIICDFINKSRHET